MKLRINFVSILGLLLMLTTFSCKKDEVQVIAHPSAPLALSASTTDLALNEADAAENAVDFNWAEADFGYSAAISYSLQVSYKGTDFQRFASVSVGQALTKSFSVEALNTLLQGAKYISGEDQSVWVRVLASVTDSLYAFSDTLKMTINPYKAKRVINFPTLYLPGGYQDWQPDNEIIARLFSVESNGSYQGYLNLTSPDNEFKFTPDQTWDLGYGDGGAGKILQAGDAGNLKIAKAGYYLVKANTKTLTWNYQLENWGIVGDGAAGWGDNDDILFDFDKKEQVLYKVLDLNVGAIKFRANHVWDLQIGKDGAYNGDNITIEKAGTYKIVLDLRVPEDPVLTITEQ